VLKMMDLKIRLGNKLLFEIEGKLEEFGLDGADHKAHEIMHIIASNQTPKEVE
jgi:hypothetical protein